MKIKLILILAISFLTTLSFAAEGNLVTIEGVVRSFDKSEVGLATSTGVVRVPRKYLPAELKLKVNDQVKIPLTKEQLATVK